MLDGIFDFPSHWRCSPIARVHLMLMEMEPKLIYSATSDAFFLIIVEFIIRKWLKR